MWLIGVLLVMFLVGCVCGLVNRRPGTVAAASGWDLGSLSASYAAILAPLAGFSVAAAVFLANLATAAQTPSFADVMAIFLIAFIMLIATAFMLAAYKSAQVDLRLGEDQLVVHRMMYMLSNVTFYLSLTMSWFGLRPMLVSIGLDTLAGVFTWLLLFAVVSGAARLAAWLHTLMGVKPVAAVAICVVPILAGVAYGLVLAPRFEGFWPAVNPVLSFAVLVFGVAGVGFTVDTVMIALHGKKHTQAAIRRIGNVLLAPHVGAAITALTLLWLSIVAE